MFLECDAWVLSGSLDGWGGSLASWFNLVAFVYTPTAIRLQRLRDREVRHFGRDAVSPGGWRQVEFEEFIDWAAHYDDATREGRNLPRHEAWLATLSCPVLRLDGTCSVSELVAQVVRCVE